MRSVAAAIAVLALGAAAASCIVGAPEGLTRETNSDGGGGGLLQPASGSGGSSNSSGTGSTDPHAVLGASPSHGSFSGGQHVIVSGKGFKPGLRIWFGDTEADGVIAIDPTKAQVNAPAGDPGPVTLRTQNGDDTSTQRELPAGYSYDALYTQPDNGPVAGGTVIHIFGIGTSWDTDLVEARVDNKPCTTLEAASASELICTVPKGTPGTKSVSVLTSEGLLSALDAYTYQDSSDGFKGGLGGAPLNGQLKVLAFDNFTGEPLQGGHAIVGSDLASALYQQVDASGVTLFQDPLLDQPVTVTVAAKCHSPITFVDVPVDTVTVYLNPVLSPICADGGDPPPVGGNPTLLGSARGELVWPSTQEFQQGKWSNVPSAKPGLEQREAYVFQATSNQHRTFTLPPATSAVTETSPGELGYGFSMSLRPGNHTLYAIAGLRNLATNHFTAYSFGAVKGVAVFPGEQTPSVIIPMDNVLDQALQLSASPPPPGPKGPDRLRASVAIELLQGFYAILPDATKTPLLPLSGSVSFIGLPGLDGPITGARYVTSGQAVTGPAFTAPLSVVRDQATTTTSIPVTLDGFVAVPQLVAPAPGSGWDGTHLAVDYPQGGFPAQMTVYELVAGDGLWRWVVAVPAAAHAVEVPDLSGFELAGLPPGPLSVGVYGARYEDFDYGTIGYRSLRPQGMLAYALDLFNAFL